MDSTSTGPNLLKKLILSLVSWKKQNQRDARVTREILVKFVMYVTNKAIEDICKKEILAGAMIVTCGPILIVVIFVESQSKVL